MRKWWRKNGKPQPEVEESELQSLVAGISTLYEARPRLLVELRRARRHERPLTLLSLVPEGVARAALNGGGNGDAHRLAARNGRVERRTASPAAEFLHFDLLFVGVLLRNTLRETDMVALSLEPPGYAVLLPETDESDGRATAARLNRVIRDRTSLTIRVGAAAFPRDGFTIDDLLGRARHDRHHGSLARTAAASKSSP